MLLCIVLAQVINLTYAQISTLYLPGSGDTIVSLDFEDTLLLDSNFNYGLGWAGSGYGLSGTHRGAPEQLKVIKNAKNVSGSGKQVLSFRSEARDANWYSRNPQAVGTRTYGNPDVQNQDGLFLYSESWVAQDVPTIMMHVFFPDSAQYISIRFTTKYNNGNSTAWPGIWNYGSTFRLRGTGRPDIAVNTNAPNGGKNTWWTMGLSIAPNGDIQYYTTPSYVTSFTKDHFLGANSKLSADLNLGYFPVETLIDEVYMCSNYNPGDSLALIDNIIYTKNALVVSVPSIKNNTLSNSIYPNPANDVINFNIGINSKFKVINTLGKIVKRGLIKNGQINISELNPGLYFLIVNNSSKSFIKR